MNLTDSNVVKFKAAKLRKENTDKINSISYSKNGNSLVTSSYDDQINIYDCHTGNLTNALRSQKYGVNLITFAHDNVTTLYSSTKIDHTIRYLSVDSFQFIQCFTGHTEEVISININPLYKTFVSSSLDKTVKLWDLNARKYAMSIGTSGRSLAAFDPEGIVISIGVTTPTNHSMRLYDIRMTDKGPFFTFNIDNAPENELTSLKHSPNGRLISVSSNGANLRLFDAFNGTNIGDFMISNATRHPIDACFSPDSNYLFFGTPDGNLQAWNIETKNLVPIIKGIDDQSINCIAFSPKYAMIATGAVKLTFWRPNFN